MGGSELATRLRTLRLAAGMTLEALAERSGVSVRGISDIERGKSLHPQPRTVEALVAGLGLDDAARRWLRAPLVSTGPDGGRTDFRPARVADFTGRGAELHRLVGLLDRHQAPGAPDPVRVVVVSGPPGIGKTAFVTEAFARAAGQGRRVFVDLAGHGRPASTSLEVLQRVLRQCDPGDPPGTLAAARARWAEVAAGERVLVHLDNVYAYGPVDGPMTEETPLRPTSRKGAVRAEALGQLDALRGRGLTVTTARSADFYGPGAATSAFQGFVVDRVVAGKRPTWLLDADQPHSLTYTPDVGDALAVLGTDERARGRTWHVPTAPPLTGREWGVLAGVARDRMSVMSLATLRLGALFAPAARETLELTYQSTAPYVFDSSRASRELGLTATPAAVGVAATLEHARAVAR